MESNIRTVILIAERYWHGLDADQIEEIAEAMVNE